MLNINDVRNKFLSLEDAMKERFYERTDEARGLALAALSGNHIFFIGPPGTAKSALIRWYCDRFVGADYFTWLLTRFSTPEELFGPVDLAGLKAGSFRRITKGKLPEAHVAFLDEIFKANSAILNSLLSALQERIFHNDGAPVKMPLIFAAAASNELPEEDESLSALYDRFLIRYNVGYIKNRDTFLDLITKEGGLNAKPVPTITPEELDAARAAVDAMKLSPEIITSIADLRDNLRKEGITVSDRRFVQALKVFKAQAWLAGDANVGADAIEIGGHIFWDKPEDSRKVMGLCLQVSNPNLFKAQTMFEAAEDAAQAILSQTGVTDTAKQAKAIETSAQLKRLAGDIEAIAGKSTKIKDMAVKVRELNKKVIEWYMG